MPRKPPHREVSCRYGLQTPSTNLSIRNLVSSTVDGDLCSVVVSTPTSTGALNAFETRVIETTLSVDMGWSGRLRIVSVQLVEYTWCLP